MIIKRFLGRHYGKLELVILACCVVAASYIRSVYPGILSNIMVGILGLTLGSEIFAVSGGRGLLARRVCKGEKYHQDGFGTVTIKESFWAPVWSPVLKAVNRYHNYS